MHSTAIRAARLSKGGLTERPPPGRRHCSATEQPLHSAGPRNLANSTAMHEDIIRNTAHRDTAQRRPARRWNPTRDLNRHNKTAVTLFPEQTVA